MSRTAINWHLIESLVMYFFTQHLNACDHTKPNLNFPWYSLWMRSKGPYNFVVTVLSHIVNWPSLVSLYNALADCV